MQLWIDRWTLGFVLIKQLISECWRARIERDGDMGRFVFSQSTYQRRQEAVSAAGICTGAAGQSAWDCKPSPEDH